ncbi:hypothetical protein HDU81_001054 [Chytriomyces hyalinus]|nr:hypothetical protein HDU81_001054 [Chytriomyces hyalinus]
MDFLSSEYSGPDGKIGYGIFKGTYVETDAKMLAKKAYTDDGIQSYLLTLVKQKRIKPNRNSYYPIYLPFGKSVSLQGLVSCINFCGYHGAVNVTKLGIPNTPYLYYAVIPDMTGSCSGGYYFLFLQVEESIEVVAATQQKYEIAKFKRDEVEAVSRINDLDKLGKVRHKPTGRILWGKMFYYYEPPEDVRASKLFRRFKKGVNQLAPVQSEYLVQIVGLCSVYDDECPSVSIFSEYMDCGSLLDIRLKHQVPNESVTSKIAVAILRGLAHLRMHGLSHGSE